MGFLRSLFHSALKDMLRAMSKEIKNTVKDMMSPPVKSNIFSKLAPINCPTVPPVVFPKTIWMIPKMLKNIMQIEVVVIEHIAGEKDFIKTLRREN